MVRSMVASGVCGFFSTLHTHPRHVCAPKRRIRTATTREGRLSLPARAKQTRPGTRAVLLDGDGGEPGVANAGLRPEEDARADFGPEKRFLGPISLRVVATWVYSKDAVFES